MFGRIKRLIRGKPQPKIKIRHRERLLGGWFQCQCAEHECRDKSRWEDKLCIKCWLAQHQVK